MIINYILLGVIVILLSVNIASFVYILQKITDLSFKLNVLGDMISNYFLNLSEKILDLKKKPAKKTTKTDKENNNEH